MLTPTAKNVKKIVSELQTRSGITQAELAALLGVSESGMKKNMMDGASHRPMSGSTWQLLLLLSDKHPQYRLVDRLPVGRQRQTYGE
ncbi:MAG TPA: winged helix-turn-helix domain-containing protein [Woeseiaceae bacterium]|nr:winged helix-turn-helix domain-containing protein [Woeseiaceae bacterium]